MVVVEQIDDFGPKDLERTAVVGAILEMECEIRAAGMALPRRWYQQHVLMHGFPSVAPLMQELASSRRFEETCPRGWRRWARLTGFRPPLGGMPRRFSDSGSW